jgi:hypothetical protein
MYSKMVQKKVGWKDKRLSTRECPRGSGEEMGKKVLERRIEKQLKEGVAEQSGMKACTENSQHSMWHIPESQNHTLIPSCENLRTRIMFRHFYSVPTLRTVPVESYVYFLAT